MNTRLQVEHPVTEASSGSTWSSCSSPVAEGRPTPVELVETSPNGHAIEVRLYAEDPAADYQPQSGWLTPVRDPGRGRDPGRRRLRDRQRGLHALRRDAGQGDRPRADPRAGGPAARRRAGPGPDPRRRHQPRPARRDPARRRVPGRRGQHRLPGRTNVRSTAAERPAARAVAAAIALAERAGAARTRPARHPGRLAQRRLAAAAHRVRGRRRRRVVRRPRRLRRRRLRRSSLDEPEPSVDCSRTTACRTTYDVAVTGDAVDVDSAARPRRG